MITSVALQNYRCFRSATFQLAPLTVFVGANGSGKSALLRALDPRIELTPSDVWRHDRADVDVAVRFEGGQGWRKHLDRNFSCGGHQYRCQFLALDLAAIRTPVPPKHVTELDRSGSQLVNLFASLSRADQIAASDELCRIVPLFTEVEHSPSKKAEGQHELRFRDRWDSKVVYGVDEVSDGTLLAFAFLLLPRQDPQPDLVVVEEPERGLHPYLLGDVVEIVRRLSRGDGGHRPVQVVMATHSPELVNHLEPEEVRFLRRDQTDGAVQVEVAPTDDPQWQRALAEYQSLGGLWLAGGLGGVPGA